MAKNFASTVASTAKPARKSRAKKVEPVQFESLSTVTAGAGLGDLDALIAQLTADEAPAAAEAPDAAPVIVIEPDTTVMVDELDELNTLAVFDEVPDSVIESEISDADLETAVSRAEATEIAMAAATPEGAEGAAVPSDGPVASPETTTTAAKVKKTPVPRKHYSDKVERLKDRVGASLAEYTVLTTADALVDEAELGKVMERTLEIIRQMNSKEKNRAGNFIEFLSGKRAKLNHVLERVLTVLDRDGYIQTGVEGNVFKDLIARPYSPASARAMGGNTIGAFKELKVILPDGKGKFVPNPDSLLLAKARSLLSATVAAAATDTAEPSEADSDVELAAA